MSAGDPGLEQGAARERDIRGRDNRTTRLVPLHIHTHTHTHTHTTPTPTPTPTRTLAQYEALEPAFGAVNQLELVVIDRHLVLERVPDHHKGAPEVVLNGPP